MKTFKKNQRVTMIDTPGQFRGTVLRGGRNVTIQWEHREGPQTLPAYVLTELNEAR